MQQGAKSMKVGLKRTISSLHPLLVWCGCWFSFLFFSFCWGRDSTFESRSHVCVRPLTTKFSWPKRRCTKLYTHKIPIVTTLNIKPLKRNVVGRPCNKGPSLWKWVLNKQFQLCTHLSYDVVVVFSFLFFFVGGGDYAFENRSHVCVGSYYKIFTTKKKMYKVVHAHDTHSDYFVLSP